MLSQNLEFFKSKSRLVKFIPCLRKITILMKILNIPVINQFSQFKNLQNEAKFLILSSMVSSLAQGFLFVDLTVYLNNVGYSPFLIGIILSTRTFIGSVLMIFLAVLSDMLGRKKFVLFGRLLLLISFIIYAITYDFSWMILVAVLTGISFASTSSSFLAWFTEKTSISDRNLAFATNSFLTGISMSFGMLMGGLPPILMNYFKLSLFNSYRLIFIVSGLLILFSILLLLKVSEKYKGKRNFEILPKKSFKFVMKLSILGLIGLGAGVIIQLFPLWFYLKFGINVDILGPIFAISQILTSIASFTTPALASKIGSIRTIAFTQASSIIILIIMPFISSYIVAGSFFILRNALMNMSSPIMNAFTMSLIPEDERAKGSAIIQTFDSIPRSIGPSIGGYFFDIGMLDVPFFITATLYSISTLLFFRMFRNIELTYGVLGEHL